MKTFDKLIKVSKASILSKNFHKDFTKENLEKEFSGEELEAHLATLPTEEEQDWWDIYHSRIAGLARLQRKMSVCLDVEVIDLEDDRIKYEYADKIYEIREPKNSFRICTELDKGIIDAFAEVCRQKCFSEIDTKTKNERIIDDVKKDGAIRIDAFRVAQSVCDKFFFQTFYG